MSSLVIELQRECLEAQSPLPHLLRKALVIAKKLKVADLDRWIANELNGYKIKKEIPPYRIVKTKVEVQDGLGRWVSMILPSSEIEDMVTTVHIFDSVSQIEGLLQNASHTNGRLAIPFPPEHARILMSGSMGYQSPMRFARIEDLRGILDTSRTEILTWCLRLEEDGIVGEGMTFSKEEQRKAETIHHNTHYHIGTMTQSQIQHGGDNISATLKVGNSDSEEINKFVALLTQNLPNLGNENGRQLSSDIELLETQVKEQQPDSSLVRSALFSVKATLEGAAGNLVASGLLYELGKFLH